MKPLKSLLFASMFVPVSVSADLYIANFEIAAGGEASGVWRNSTTSTDLGIQVKLTHSGGTFSGDTQLDNAFTWIDSAFGVNFFNPSYNGDFVELEVAGGATVPVTIVFNASVVDPVLNFADVDEQTTLVFSTGTPLQVGGWANMLVAGNSVGTSGLPANPVDPFDAETLGSVKFTGTFTELSFEIRNTGVSPSGDSDQTGFSVSTNVEPVVPPVVLPMLDIATMGANLHLSWPDTSSFSAIEYTTNPESGPWMPLPGASPTTETSFMAPLSNFGDELYIRAVYSF